MSALTSRAPLIRGPARWFPQAPSIRERPGEARHRRARRRPDHEVVSGASTSSTPCAAPSSARRPRCAVRGARHAVRARTPPEGEWQAL
jgi:hypothetical protein